jgi:hypothetical protein
MLSQFCLQDLACRSVLLAEWHQFSGRVGLRLGENRGAPFASNAHYGEFVQGEQRKANGQFGAKRTVVSVMPSGVEQR